MKYLEKSDVNEKKKERKKIDPNLGCATINPNVIVKSPFDRIVEKMGI